MVCYGIFCSGKRHNGTLWLLVVVNNCLVVIFVGIAFKVSIHMHPFLSVATDYRKKFQRLNMIQFNTKL